MDFSNRQAQPQKHLTGIAVVVLLHVAVVYALVTGLGKKVIDVIRAPIETKVIEEIKKPPPPPEPLLPPPPKLEAPPPPFIPPPEVVVTAPAPVAPTITATPTPPPPVAEIAPVAPPAPPAPPAPAPPAPKVEAVTIGTICPNIVKPDMPRKATQEGISGSVVARATIKGGKVVDVQILKSQPRGVFDNAVRNAMAQYGCTGDHIADQEFVFKLD